MTGPVVSGSSRERPPISRGVAVALFVALGLTTLYVIDLDRSFGNSDEVIYAEFIRAMHSTGAYHELRYDGHLTLQRPPVSVALYALVARIVPGELGMRLLPALLTVLMCLVAGAAVLSLERRLDAALVTTLVVAGCPSVYVYGRLLSNDPPFVLACAAALWATMTAQRNPRWFLWALAAIGATFATKSFAGAIPAVALGPWIVIAARRHRRDRGLRPLRSIAVFFAVALPYFVLGAILYGELFIEEHVGFNLLRRAFGEITGLGQGGPAFYLEHLVHVDGPLTAVLLLASAVSAAIVAARRRDPCLGVAATYCGLTFVLLSAVRWKTGHYLLPFYPGAAICCGVLVAKLVPTGEGSRPILRVVAPAIAATLLLYALADPVVEPTLQPSPMTENVARAARDATSVGEKVYSLNWYAPALGYYAERSWGLLSTSKRGALIVHQTHLFKNAGTVVLGPPWPRGRLVVAVNVEWLPMMREMGLENPRMLYRSGSIALLEVDQSER